MTYECLGRRSTVRSESICDNPCYFGNITRELAADILKRRAICEGTYLVRKGEDGCYRLSVTLLDGKDSYSVTHYKIASNQNWTYSLELGYSFGSIAALIEYYRGENTNMIQPLREPCPHVKVDGTNDGVGRGSGEPVDTSTTGELQANDIEIETKILIGKFHEIWKGKYLHQDDVVIKISTEEKGSKQFLLQEGHLIKHLSHNHLVRCFGVVHDHLPFLVYEYCPDRDLLDYFLRGGTYEISKNEHLRFAEEVSSALEYLSNKNFVHRNVKASNVLVSSSCTCKLGGFGYMAELNNNQTYKEKKDEKAFNANSVRWMAIEAIENRTFSTASDVWSFACLLIEIFTHGEAPFSGILTPNVLKKVKENLRPPKPGFIPNDLYDLMIKCWNPLPEKRPNFNEIQKLLVEIRKPPKERAKLLQRASSVPSAISRVNYKPNFDPRDEQLNKYITMKTVM